MSMRGKRMPDEIDRILKNSSKADLIEALDEELAKADYKVIAVLIEDKEKGSYSSQVMTLGLQNSYEGIGILEIAKGLLLGEDNGKPKRKS